MIESQLDSRGPDPVASTAPVTGAAGTITGRRAGAPWMRRLGNLLIVAGVLLMAGVGGYLAWQTYTNTQEAQQIAAQHAAAGQIDWLPPTAAPAGAPANSAGSGAAQPLAPAALPANDTIRVDSAPLPQLNTGQAGSNPIGQVPSQPPIHIAIPAVRIDANVVPVGWEMIPGKDGQASSQWQVADYAAGHHQGTANPGQIGNVVISGHVDWKGEVFKNLHEAKRGDEIHIYTQDREFLYIVQDIVLVKEDGVPDEQKRQNARYMDPTPDQTLTLITCFPYGIDDHRLIVIAKPYDSNLAARPDLVIK